MTTLTLATNKEHGGQCDQVELFEKLFGASVDVTPELCAEHFDKFDWNWAAEHLLTPTGLAEYLRVTASAWAEYKRVKAPAWAEYKRVTAPALAEYKRITAPALAEYHRVTAPAFGKLFSEQKYIA